MKFRLTLFSLFFLPLIAIHANFAPPDQSTIPPSPLKPNVLLIVMDDAAPVFGSYGGPAHTPNLDALAGRGRRYTMAFTNSTGCTPSRISFATGIMPFCVDTMQEHDWRNVMNSCEPGMGDAAKTMYQEFKEAGYSTAAVGKVMHTLDWQAIEFEYSKYLWAPNIQMLVDNMPIHGLTEFYAAGAPFRDWGPMEDLRGPNGELITEADLIDHRIADEALTQLQDAKEPFFLALGMAAPHLPNYPPRRLFDKYMGMNLPLPDVLLNDADDLGPAGRALSIDNEHNQLVVSEILSSPEEWQKFNAAYYANLEFVDEQIGRVLAAIPDNTIIVVWSDHGYHFGQKLKIEKGAVWRQSYHIPLIVAGPGVHPEVVNDVTNSTEVYTMLLGMAGLAPTDGVERTPVEDGIVVFLGNVAVDDGEKAIIQYADGQEREFYDMTADPQQWRNLTPEPGYIEKLNNYLK